MFELLKVLEHVGFFALGLFIERIVSCFYPESKSVLGIALRP